MPLRSPAATTRSAPARLIAIGISIRVCLPASRQRIACASCWSLGVPRMTMSTAGSARASSSDNVHLR